MIRLIELLQNLTHSDWIALIGIVTSSIIAFLLYILGKKIDDKQRIEHILLIQDTIGNLLRDGPCDIELYNTKLYDKRQFEKNCRSRIWGYAYHGAGLYSYGFAYVEFITETINWGGEKFHRVGLIPYKRIFKVMPHGDGSTSKPVLFVSPKLLQHDKYSIAYEKFVYYKLNGGGRVSPPVAYTIRRLINTMFRKVRY